MNINLLFCFFSITVIYTIEFQKRGLPHAHILVFLNPKNRCVKPEHIDKIISAEIPDKDTDPELFKIVTSLMIHGPCGPENESSPCMDRNKCTKHFPKKYQNETFIDPDGYPVYKRRDNGVSIKKGSCFADNRYVFVQNMNKIDQNMSLFTVIVYLFEYIVL